MWTRVAAAGDDDDNNVLDLSLKHSAAHDSPASTTPRTQSAAGVMAASLQARLDSCSSRSPGQLTLLSSCVSSQCPLHSQHPVCTAVTSTSHAPSSALTTLKRPRQHSGHDTSSSSSSSCSIETHEESHEERCRSEPPLRLEQSSDMHQMDTDDVGYMERRRKNNEAAKRSRDARRLKERQTAQRVAALQQENVQLKAEIVVLRNQAANLHCLLYNQLGIKS